MFSTPSGWRALPRKRPSRSGRTEWRFDGPAPSLPPPPPPGAPARPPAPFPATRGWEAGPGVSGLAIRDGMLVGRSTTDFPILHVERTAGLDNADQLHAVEVRLRVSKGANLLVATSPAPTVDLSRAVALASRIPWIIRTPSPARRQGADVHDDAARAHLGAAYPSPDAPPHRCGRRGFRDRVGAARLPARASGEHTLGRELAGPARDLSRDARDPDARDGAVRPEGPAESGPRSVAGHAGGRGGHVPRRRAARRQGRARADAHRDHPLPLGARSPWISPTSPASRSRSRFPRRPTRTA